MSLVVAAEPFINVHREPDPASEVVTQARLGDVAEVTERIAPPASYLHLNLVHDGYGGWAADAGFAEGTWPPAGSAVVRAVSLFANLHAGPGVRTPLLFSAPLGSPLVKRGEAADGWIPLGLPGGLDAFVQSGDVCEGTAAWMWGSPAELRSSAVRQARALLGLPYRWGGTTPFGLDCSGLVQLVYRLHGVDLPRDVRDQVQDPRLAPVSPEELGPGDLLVFRGATHIGLAVSPAEFLHATTAVRPVVQITPVDDPHWTAILDGCYRVIPSVVR